jgi:hypothetical protein
MRESEATRKTYPVGTLTCSRSMDCKPFPLLLSLQRLQTSSPFAPFVGCVYLLTHP